MLSIRILILFGLVCLLAGRPALAARQVTLESGRAIVLQGGWKPYTQGGVRGISLTYRTATPLTEREALVRECNAVWGRYIVNIEDSAYAIARLTARANASASGDGGGKAYICNFVRRKGSWHMLEPGNPGKLDKRFMTAFLKRVDWLEQRAAAASSLLYVSRDIALTVSETNGAADGNKYGYEDYVRFAHNVERAVSDYHYRRRILKLTILANGRSARIVSRIWQRGSIGGNRLATVSRTYETWSLRDGTVVLTQARAVVEKQIEGE